jgi:hypothetical protein
MFKQPKVVLFQSAGPALFKNWIGKDILKMKLSIGNGKRKLYFWNNRTGSNSETMLGLKIQSYTKALKNQKKGFRSCRRRYNSKSMTEALCGDSTCLNFNTN